MKIEVNSFTPASNVVIVSLDDPTIDIKAMHFQVTKNGSNINGSTGFSDSIKNRARYMLDSSIKDSGRSTAYSVLHKADVSGVSTTKLAGKVVTNGFSITGEFEMYFDNYDNTYLVDFMAIGV